MIERRCKDGVRKLFACLVGAMRVASGGLPNLLRIGLQKNMRRILASSLVLLFGFGNSAFGQQALAPASAAPAPVAAAPAPAANAPDASGKYRSEEHTSELQSPA